MLTSERSRSKSPATRIDAELKEKSPQALVDVDKKILSPAAGPKTASGDEENNPKKRAPKMAVMIPASGGAPEATAIPAESGNETSKSDKDDRKSFLFKGVSVK